MSEKKYIFLSSELSQRTDFTKPRKYKGLIKEFQKNISVPPLSHITDSTWIRKCLEWRNFGVTTKESSGEEDYQNLMRKGLLYLACFSLTENSEGHLVAITWEGIPFMFVCPSDLHCEKIMVKTDEKGFFKDCEVTCKEMEAQKAKASCFVNNGIENCTLHDGTYTPGVMSGIRSMVKLFYSQYKNIIEIPIFHYSNLLDILSWIEMHQRYMEFKKGIVDAKKSNVNSTYMELFRSLLKGYQSGVSE